MKRVLRDIQPASLAPFDRRGVRLFEDRFEMKLFAEGTIRGTGGLRITGPECQTSVPGLFAAGDAATRELIAGATSGGGAQNSAWALSSGTYAGEGAARMARIHGRRIGEPANGTGGTALRPASSPHTIDLHALVREVQAEAIDYGKVLRRSRAALQASLTALDARWHELARHCGADGPDQVAAREVAAMTATARWCTAAALARDESRGMHDRIDRPQLSPHGDSRLLTGGLDKVWSRLERVPQHPGLSAAA